MLVLLLLLNLSQLCQLLVLPLSELPLAVMLVMLARRGQRPWLLRACTARVGVGHDGAGIHHPHHRRSCRSNKLVPSVEILRLPLRLPQLRAALNYSDPPVASREA